MRLALSDHFCTFCAFCTQRKGTNREEHKTASPSTQRKQSFYATSFCVPSAIPKACCLNTTYKSAGCRNARQRTNARLPSNNTNHVSDQKPSCSSISRKKLFHSYQQSGCTTKNLTNCFSSTPGRLQMKRGTVTLMNRACWLAGFLARNRANELNCPYVGFQRLFLQTAEDTEKKFAKIKKIGIWSCFAVLCGFPCCCLTFAPKSYPLLTTLSHFFSFASFEPGYVSVNFTSMAVMGDVKAREILVQLEGFPRGRKRDLRTTFKFGNPGQLIILMNYFVAADVGFQCLFVIKVPCRTVTFSRAPCLICIYTCVFLLACT